MGQVAEICYDNPPQKPDTFFFPFVEAEKTYKIRLVFYREEEEDDDGNGFVIDYRDDDGVVGWFETELTAGPESKGEVRFTSKGKISVNKKGDFRFTQKPTFTNEHLLDEEWAVDIGVVEGISWEHGAERKTKWHSIGTPIPCTELTKQINLYDYREQHKSDWSDWDTESEISIDFICVRPVMSYEYNGKEYKYQWEGFAQDLYYPPLEPEFLHGIYFEFDLPQDCVEADGWCDVVIDGIGKVAEHIHIYEGTNKGSFFYPFVQADKEYTVHFSFKRNETEDSEGFVDYATADNTIKTSTQKVTAGPRAKGEVSLTKTGRIEVSPNYNIDYFEKPTFQNEELLGNNWQIEIGLVEGVSWEHGAERRTNWHCQVAIPTRDFETCIGKNLTSLEMSPRSDANCDHNHEIDFICLRPIMSYEYDKKTYNYMWDGFTRDIHYPLRNPDGIYLEFDVPKREFSRCDVTIDGIGKVAEEVCVDKNKASFFYPFVEPNKEYTIYFSFKMPEPVDSEGFVIPTHGSDTINEVTKTVTAGSRAKGEVRLLSPGGLKADPECNITYFAKPKFQNEHLLGNDWMIEMGLVEGISWEHGDERRTKWHCAVRVPNNYTLEHRNLRDLPSEHESYEDHSVHKIDFLCVRPVMSYEYAGKEYNYMWEGFTSDINYPMNAYFEEIDINDPSQVNKIYGTWKYSESWTDYYYQIAENYYISIEEVCTKTLIISDDNLSWSIHEQITKKDGSTFTDAEKSFWEFDNHDSESEKHITTISADNKKITIINQWLKMKSLSEHFADYISTDGMYTQYCKFKLFQDKNQLHMLYYGQNDGQYYEWTDVYYKQ